MRAISPEVREQIVERYYRPHRTKIERYVERAVAQRRRVIHLACHSFTPKLDGVARRADVGLTTSLRRRFGPAAYVGVEIEINQKHVFGRAPGWSALRRALILSLWHALA
jgi:predicted N-formylglutamate amidohydrolase